MAEVGEANALASARTVPDELDAARALNNEFLKHHPEEVADFLNGRGPAETALVVGKAEVPLTAAQILERMNPRVAADAVLLLTPAQAGLVITAMNAVRAAPIVVSMPLDARDALLGRLEKRVATEIRDVLSYPSESAGALMDPRITAFGEDLTVDDALAKMRTFKEKDISSIYLQDRSGQLVGAVPLGEIATATPETKLKDLIRGTPTMVHVNASREEIVEYLNTQRLATLPVVDSETRLVGVIRYRQLVAAAEAEATLSLQTMVGVSKEERALSSPVAAVKSRLPWLEINLATAFLAAAVVGLFEDTIAKYTALAVLLPVVAGQSGNSGMQAQAVTMRGLALREIRVGHWPRLALKEVGVGITNGIAVGITTMLGVFFWSHSFGLTLVIGLAMVLSMISANFWGTMVPIVLKALGQDPATSSSIVLTTFTDCGGFLSFLGLATLLSSLLPPG
ncbi:MAG TPA: magnesium transporter [Candidatus Limnocylindria bacterium]|nr:magnesium transporter [Candidatus Limnocylindria bacterium]